MRCTWSSGTSSASNRFKRAALSWLRPKGFSSTRFVPSGSDTCCSALQAATVTEGGSAKYKAGAGGHESISDCRSSGLVTSALAYRVVASTLCSASSETFPSAKEVRTRCCQASEFQSSEPAPTSTTSRRDSSRSSNCPRAGKSSRPDRSPLAPSNNRLPIEPVIVPSSGPLEAAAAQRYLCGGVPDEWIRQTSVPEGDVSAPQSGWVLSCSRIAL